MSSMRIAMGTTLAISSCVWIFERLIEAKLHTAVSPSLFSLSTIHIFFPLMLSSAVTFLAGLLVPLSTASISSSSYASMVPSSKINLVLYLFGAVFWKISVQRFELRISPICLLGLDLLAASLKVKNGLPVSK